jgi:hypothetical protein
MLKNEPRGQGGKIPPGDTPGQQDPVGCVPHDGPKPGDGAASAPDSDGEFLTKSDWKSFQKTFWDRILGRDPS